MAFTNSTHSLRFQGNSSTPVKHWHMTTLMRKDKQYLYQSADSTIVAHSLSTSPICRYLRATIAPASSLAESLMPTSIRTCRSSQLTEGYVRACRHSALFIQDNVQTRRSSLCLSRASESCQCIMRGLSSIRRYVVIWIEIRRSIEDWYVMHPKSMQERFAALFRVGRRLELVADK
ncbi:hypothetical protein PYCCODRAFT_1440531 [Trametes coccinea BRFM310]|uniref:Uncharacterized protein n=1 Tax=Trametes coccinea (strain BRFM310) TaxID=1353009 RepID=A0A1Y2I8R0_TRAC3|nr:hypothetical protein PYCCODRAFT_1440531 [Trametes coccinea BRFM310]